MTAFLLALAPIFALIGLGFSLKTFRILDAGFWESAERLTYFVLFPAYLISNVAEANLSGMPILELSLSHGSALILALLATAALAPMMKNVSGPSFSSIFQGVQRPNTYVALAAASTLYGQTGVALAAFCAVVVVPMVNIWSVIGMIHWAHPKGDGHRGKMIAKALATNPLILSCLIGGVINWSGNGVTPALGATFKILGQASLCIGLLVVGAGIDLSSLHTHRWPLAISMVGKLIVLPCLVWVVATHLGVTQQPLEIAVLYASVPTSASAYILARQLNGDHRLMAAIITITTRWPWVAA